jgi:zinc protease
MNFSLMTRGKSNNARSLAVLALVALLFSPGGLRGADASSIAERPEKLTFPPLDFQPPEPSDYRTPLKSGAIAYVVPSRELPLVNIVIYVRTGDYLVPVGKEGLAGLCGFLLSKSGTKNRSAEELEERVDYLGAQLGSGIGDTQGSVSLNLLSKDLDEGLTILREVLTEPRFQTDRVQLTKEQTLQSIRERNDDSSSIEGRERNFLGFGESFWANRLSTGASIEGITEADLRAFHEKWFHPSNFVVSVSGDFDKAAMVEKLDKLFANWPFAFNKPPEIPGGTEFAKPGVYLVNKQVNQGRVSILLPGIRRDDPEYFSVMIMNDILGGGGFTSHIMNRVRSDEGLAYSAYSSFPGGVHYPLLFTAAFQSKSRTVAYAASIVLDELKKMANDTVNASELSTSKRGFIDRLPRSFATKAQVANNFAQDEMTGRFARDPHFWREFRTRIEKIDAASVQAMAKKFLDVNKVVILVVGEKAEILKGHPNHPEVKLESLAGGNFVEVPLRDPLTLKPLPAQ